MRCAFYGFKVVDRFPAGCPLKMANPCDEVNRLKTAAYGLLDPQSPGCDSPRGRQMLRRAEACSGCLANAFSSPVVQYLRRPA